MERAIQLACSGLGYTKTNPLVGAVLVGQEGQIIGEGWHQSYGGAHAEINAINQVADKNALRGSTLYVTLEPCNHQGKTPPCTDALIKHGIERVVVGIQDPFALVNGSGIQRLKEFSIAVDVGMCEEACKMLNKRFLYNQKTKLPYVVLKWAQSLNGIAGSGEVRETLKGKISSGITRRLVHKWRAEEQAILVGYKTIISDNPALGVDYGLGPQPQKVVLDPYQSLIEHRLSESLQGWIQNRTPSNEVKSQYIRKVLSDLFEQGIGSILVEGGPRTHQKFLESGLWNECRVIIANRTLSGKVTAPGIPHGNILSDTTCAESGDRIIWIKNSER